MKRAYSKTSPVPKRLKRAIWFPSDIKEETMEDETTQYSFINNRIEDTGQNITDASWISAQAAIYNRQAKGNTLQAELEKGCDLSLGFKIDFFEKNRADWLHLFVGAKEIAKTDPTATLEVCDYNNNTHLLTIIQVTTLFTEMSLKYQTLLNTKWS